MSLSIISVLMIGMISAMLITSRSVQTDVTPVIRSARGSRLLDDVLADLNVAITFTERTDKAVSFKVPDRDGDGLPELVRYAWSGNAGDPLTYECNGGDPVIVAEDVHRFDLSYLIESATGSGAGAQADVAPVESGEVELLAHDDGPRGTIRDQAITKDGWIGASIHPELPTNATGWSVTRVLVRAAATGSTNGVVSLEARSVDQTGAPTDTVLESASIVESSLTTESVWLDVPFSALSSLDPAAGLAIVARFVSGSGTALEMQVENGHDTPTPGVSLISTTDAGASWASTTLQQPRIYVYGTYTTTGTPQWP